MCRVEDKYEQICNLLALWKARLPEYYEEPINQAAVQRFQLCIEELEAILAGKPLP
jgi:hypothetical protein